MRPSRPMETSRHRASAPSDGSRRKALRIDGDCDRERGGVEQVGARAVGVQVTRAGLDPLLVDQANARDEAAPSVGRHAGDDRLFDPGEEGVVAHPLGDGRAQGALVWAGLGAGSTGVHEAGRGARVGGGGYRGREERRPYCDRAAHAVQHRRTRGVGVKGASPAASLASVPGCNCMIPVQRTPETVDASTEAAGAPMSDSRLSPWIAQNPLTKHPLYRRVLIAPEGELE